MTTRAATYRRISEDREGRELGIGRQDEDLDALARRNGHTIVATYVDNDISASTLSTKNRPGYQQMIADAKAGKFDVILAYTSGRLTRRPLELEGQISLARDHGIRFEYVRSPDFDLNTAQGREFARMLAVRDAGESEQISERVARDAERRARQGLNHGGRRCFGYAPNGLDVIPEEAEIIREAAEHLIHGVPLGRIVNDLNADGITTVSGKRWSPTTMRDLLMRPRLAGRAVYRGEDVGPGQWPAILDAHTHALLVTMFSNPARRTTTGNRAAYLLSGIAGCAVCGGTITSFGIKRRENGATRYLYRCRKGACVARRRDWCDTWITDNVTERLSRPDARDLLVNTDRPDIKALTDEAERLNGKLTEFAEDRAADLITRAQYLAGTEKVRARLAEIDAQRIHTDRAPILRDLIEAADPRVVWDSLDLDRQRAVVKTLMRITFHPGGGGKRTFDPSKVEIEWLP